MSLTCLNTLVGLSKTAYTCFTDDLPDDYDTSDSGFHLTDTDYGLTIVDQCTLEGWTLLEAARTQAITEFKSDLRAKLRSMYVANMSAFSGLIGQVRSTGTVSVTRDFVGLRFRMRNQKGANLVLKKLYVGLNTSGDYTVRIRSNDPLYVAPDDITVSVTANALTSPYTFSPEITLSCYSRSCPDEYLEYYVSLELNGALPLNNTLTCCGRSQPWQNHTDVSGFEADDATAETNTNFSSNAYGLAVDAYLSCEWLDWLCEISELNGYDLLEIAARCIQMRGAAIGISALIDTLNVSPCTGYQLENLNSRRTYLNTTYAQNVDWIAANLPPGVTDCFKCKPQQTFTRAFARA